MSTKYIRTQLLLDPQTRARLDEIAGREQRSRSDIVREMLGKQLHLRNQQEMAAASQALLADYKVDEELTVFTALDGEDVHA